MVKNTALLADPVKGASFVSGDMIRFVTFNLVLRLPGWRLDRLTHDLDTMLLILIFGAQTLKCLLIGRGYEERISINPMQSSIPCKRSAVV